MTRAFICAPHGARGEAGQSTVEYALVTVAFLSMIVGLAALWRMLDAAALVEHALVSASHHVQASAPGGVADVFLY